jgi:hypothetical protein
MTREDKLIRIAAIVTETEQYLQNLDTYDESTLLCTKLTEALVLLDNMINTEKWYD